MEDAERAIFSCDLHGLSEACRSNINPKELIRLVVIILAMGVKDAFHILEDSGAHANLPDEYEELTPLELWHDYCALKEYSYSEELDGFGYDDVLRQGCQELIEWGANPYLCEKLTLDEWCFWFYNEQFKVNVEQSVIATLKGLKPKLGKDIATYIGKYVWYSKAEWDKWPKRYKRQRTITEYMK